MLPRIFKVTGELDRRGKEKQLSHLSQNHFVKGNGHQWRIQMLSNFTTASGILSLFSILKLSIIHILTVSPLPFFFFFLLLILIQY